jgi:hypothetical protein
VGLFEFPEYDSLRGAITGCSKLDLRDRCPERARQTTTPPVISPHLGSLSPARRGREAGPRLKPGNWTHAALSINRCRRARSGCAELPPGSGACGWESFPRRLASANDSRDELTIGYPFPHKHLGASLDAITERSCLQTIRLSAISRRSLDRSNRRISVVALSAATADLRPHVEMHFAILPPSALQLQELMATHPGSIDARCFAVDGTRS